MNVKIGILTLLGHIFLAIGSVKEVTVNLLHKNPRGDLAVTVRASLTVYIVFNMDHLTENVLICMEIFIPFI